MSEQVQEPKKEEKKYKTYKELLEERQKKPPTRKDAVLGFGIMLLVLFGVISLLVYLFKDPDPIDFTAMSREEIFTAVKELDKDITKVDISLYNEQGGEVLFVNVRPHILMNLLTESAMSMQRVTEKIMAQKGADHFEGIYFNVRVMVVDNKNNKSEQHGARFFWSKESLHGINWNGLTEDQFLNLVDKVELNRVFRSTVINYCSEEENIYSPFCVTVKPEINY